MTMCYTFLTMPAVCEYCQLACPRALGRAPRPLLVAGDGPWDQVKVDGLMVERNMPCGCAGSVAEWIEIAPYPAKALWAFAAEDVYECLSCGATWTPRYET